MVNKAIHIMNILDDAGYTEVKNVYLMKTTDDIKSYVLIPLMGRINFLRWQPHENGRNGWKYHIMLETNELYEWKHYIGDLDYWEWELIGTASDENILEVVS